MTNTLRHGFQVTAMMLGLVALALISTNLLLGSGGVSDQTSFGVGSTAVDIVLSKLQSAAFPLACIALVACASRPYWAELLAQPSRPRLMIGFFILGTIFALTINNPIHDYLIRTFLNPSADGAAPQISLSPAAEIAYLISSLVLVAIIVPIAEELVDRGMMFEELKELPAWQIVIWSIIVFSFSHYLVFGIFKVVAVVPMAIVYALIRLKFGSWKYAAAAHAGLNAAVTIAWYF